MAVTWNCADDIPGLVESLVASRVADAVIDVVVVDNDSSDDTLDRVRAGAPSFAIVQLGRDAGYAAGANAGMAALGECDAYLILNPDIRFRPDAIEALWTQMRDSGAGITVPLLTDGDGRVRHSLRREPTIARAWGEALLGGARASRVAALGEVVSDASAYTGASRADWATGAIMLISEECRAAVGPWDESYFFYSEETDFALRARDLGYALVLAPDAVAMHDEGESHESPSLYARLSINRVKLYRSRHGGLATTFFSWGVGAGLALRARRPTHRAALRALLGVEGIAEEPAPPSSIGERAAE
ncbi:glycosyltransferase family 2 protein [Agromyces lapidis]|uniref:glycosyltransferase family 2 protein n=1 Tax=Agromyces lapidis TaxID=279574 RepID=UPI001478497F|nr:glycosyltransferase [Agromyces lapidis]